MALERVPSDIRAQGGVARMSHPRMIREVQRAVSIPVMAKVRVGHFVEAQILQALEVDFIDESEVLTPADEQFHIDKAPFKVPFVCGCKNLGEALRRIQEGAAMIRTKGEAGTGNIVEVSENVMMESSQCLHGGQAVPPSSHHIWSHTSFVWVFGFSAHRHLQAVRHARAVSQELRKVLAVRAPEEMRAMARELGVGVEMLQRVQAAGRLPVVQFAAGGVATPADAALLMQLGMDGVFVGSGVFKSADPPAMAKAIVQAVTHYRDPLRLAECCAQVGEPMRGLEIDASKITLFAHRDKV